MTTDMPLLGVMQLQNTPVTVPGSMGHPDSYEAPVVFSEAPLLDVRDAAEEAEV